jgi:hypothetical protein
MHTKWSIIKHQRKVKQVYTLLVAHTNEPLVELAEKIVDLFETKEELEEAIVRETAFPISKQDSTL